MNSVSSYSCNKCKANDILLFLACRNVLIKNSSPSSINIPNAEQSFWCCEHWKDQTMYYKIILHNQTCNRLFQYLLHMYVQPSKTVPIMWHPPNCSWLMLQVIIFQGHLLQVWILVKSHTGWFHVLRPLKWPCCHIA